MGKFRIFATETIRYYVDIEADTEETAREAARELDKYDYHVFDEGFENEPPVYEETEKLDDDAPVDFDADDVLGNDDDELENDDV